MFDKWTSLFRLAFFLLLSTAVHAGVAFYDWGEGPAEPSPVRVSVSVSMVPVTSFAPALSDTQTHPAKPVRKIVKKQKVVSKQLKKAPPLSAAKPVEAVRVERAAIKVSADEEICRPMQVVDCPQPETLASVEGSTDMSLSDNRLAVLETLPEGRETDVDVTPFAGEPSEAAPDYRSNPLPEYPYLARQKHWEGVVWLRVNVSADGLVDDLSIEKSCGHAILDREASRTVRRWRFSPAERAGMPVSSQVRIPVRFRLEDG